MPTVTPEMFVKSWQQSKNFAEMSKKTGLSKTAIASRRTFYQRKGIALKHMKSVGRAALSVSALNKLAKRFLRVGGTK